MTPEKKSTLKTAEERHAELEEWLLDNSFLHKDWDKTVSEYNALSVKIATLKGEKLQSGGTLIY